jgi:hypothetical protein
MVYCSLGQIFSIILATTARSSEFIKKNKTIKNRKRKKKKKTKEIIQKDTSRVHKPTLPVLWNAETWILLG